MFVERSNVIAIFAEPVCFASEAVSCFAQTLYDTIFKLFFEALEVSASEYVVCETIAVKDDDVTFHVLDSFN